MMRHLAVAVAGAALVLAAAPAPAHAEDEIGLSRDGVHWTADLTDPLFEPQVRWVPGDVRTSSFYVRNERSDEGNLRVAVDKAVSGTLRDSGWLAISARAGDRPWTEITDGERHELVAEDEVPSRTPVLVEVRVALSADAPNNTMMLSTDLDFSVRLTDSLAVLDDSDEIVGWPSVGPDGVGPGGEAPDDGAVNGTQGAAGFLPATGSELPGWLPPLALLLLGSGAYLVVRSRRRDDETEGACGDLADQHLPA